MTRLLHSRKRSNPPSNSPNSCSRRKRLKQENEGAEAKQRSTRPGKTVRLDELAWREVTMPDRLDDVEGFFGLEEVGNVGVVRDGAGVKFIKFGDTESNGERRSKEEVIVDDGGLGDDGDEDGVAEEWGGIESSNEDDNKDVHKSKPATVKNPTHTTFHGDRELSSFDFSVLNEDTPEENVALPNWAPLNLSPPTLRALARLKFTSPTPIQSAAIPQILSGHCIIGKASTGSGKTLAFGIPILEKYLATVPPCLQDNGRRPRKLTGLIISPTRELAHQITKHLTEISYYTELKIIPITGGLSVQKQQRLLNKGVDVIVATPGRLWEIVSEGQGWVERLRNVRVLVLDEADRVLEQGHFKEVEQILNLMDAQDGQSSDEAEDENAIKGETGVRIGAKRTREKAEAKKQSPAKPRMPSPQRQTLVFSATFNKGLQQKLFARKKNNKDLPKGDLLSNQESMEYLLQKLRFASEPAWVDVDPLHSVSQNVKQGIIECGSLDKDLYLYYLLLRYPCRTLIFTNSISAARRLVPLINYLFPPSSTTATATSSSSSSHSQQHMAYPLHSQLPQKSRLRSLERFASSQITAPILVATDVAARGLDLPRVALVVHYHMPRSADVYVHRAGRTGRITTLSTTSSTSLPSSSPVDGSSVLLCAPGEALGMVRLTAKVNPTMTTAASQPLFQTLPIDRTLVTKLHRRVSLAQNIAQAEIDRHKLGKEQQWLRSAAADLGVDFDEEEIMRISGGRGKGKIKMNGRREVKGSNGKGKGGGKGGVEWDDGDGDEVAGNQYGATKAEIDRWKWELKSELEKKLNTGGFSVKYLTSGNLNLAEHLLKGEGHGGILGEERRYVLDEMR